MSWAVLGAAGEPRATIRVRNLQATLGGGAAQDAWGRNGRPQPCLLSAEVALQSPFPEAAVSDSVAQDTVHYGTLSKAMVASVNKWQVLGDVSTNAPPQKNTLGDVVDTLWADLTGSTVTGQAPPAPLPPPAGGKPVLHAVAALSRLTVSVLLPKASLAGDGVSLTATAVLGLGPSEAAAAADKGKPWATSLKLHRLRVPVLVGVHPHERTAKQAIVADVTLDGYGAPPDLIDEYVPLEALVVRTLEASSFETLEALATHLGHVVLAWGQASSKTNTPPVWNVHISLEKPLAVPFADAPIVEVRMGSALA